MDEELKQIYQADQDDRSKPISDGVIWENDDKRMARVKEILATDKKLEGIDYHHAAMIFQHGETAEDYQKAHELALKAVELGDESARWLAAASFDRYLLMTGKAQKYGTQFRQNEKGEYAISQPIDPTVTDEERALWHVPTLKEAQMRMDEKNGKSL